MATANSPYSSTEETPNANRACRLLLGPCTDQLRDVLRIQVPPSTFATEINKHKPKLPRLNPEQRKLILPHNGSYSGNYDDLDISLLYILLRNICNITPHTNGWGNVPDAKDVSLSANIERIRIARNKTLHSARPSLANSEFNDIWTTVRVAVVAIDTFLSNRNLYEKEVSKLQHTTMDPVQDKYYREQLAKQYEDDQECIRMLREHIGIYHKETRSKISYLEEQLKRTLQLWKSSVFYETSFFNEIKNFCISHQIIIVVGSPGSGKTALIRHIALQMESNNQIVPISKPADIITYGDIHRQIFVIDDVLGMFALERNLLLELERYWEQIKNVLDTKSRRSKLFMSCRLAVYKEAKKLDVEYFSKDNIINLDSEEKSLTQEDRKGIFESHSKTEGISCVIDAKVLCLKDVLMFPLLCQLFCRDKGIREYGMEFFAYSFKCLVTEIGKIRKRNTMQYLSMVLCMLNNNNLSEEMLHNSEMLEEVCRSCRVKGIPQIWEILEQLSHLVGTYIAEKDKKYTFIHDSIFEVVAFQYGQQFPDQILKNMNSNFISTRVALESIKVTNNIFIKITKSHYENLAYRFYDDVRKGKLHDVFLHKALDDLFFKRHFMNLLTRTPYEDVKTFFLLQREECFDSIIFNSQKQEEGDEEETIGQSKSERQELLLGFKCIGHKRIYEIRAIRFIIYYGHLELLKYFIALVARYAQPINTVLGSTQEERINLLVLACFNGDLEMVQFLVKKIGKENINKMPVRKIDMKLNHQRCITPVIAACLKINHNVIKYLVSIGADLNPENSFYPALWNPVKRGDLKTITYLIISIE